MSFAAPVFLAAGALAALAMVALHFLARQRPRAVPFPTARFIPERTARAPSRALHPTDLPLLLLRTLALILLGAAFARPVWEAARHGTVRVVLLDHSRAVRSAAEARDSAAAWLREGDALVLFDSAARVVMGRAVDSLRALPVSRAPGSLSAALVAAHQAVALVAEHADSAELVIVSPLSREEWDAATSVVRAQWPGAIRVVRVGMAVADLERGAVEIRGASDDPLRAAGLGARRSARGVRVVRGEATAADSVWAADPGRVLVRWPAHFPDPPRDTTGALVMGDDVVVAPFPRHVPPTGGDVIARWADGSAAVAERPAKAGCVRDVAVEVPAAGDLVLREGFRRVTAGLFAPCGGAPDVRALGDPRVAELRGPAALAPARAWGRNGDRIPPIAKWLLVGAAVLLVAEPLLRRRAA